MANKKAPKNLDESDKKISKEKAKQMVDEINSERKLQKKPKKDWWADLRPKAHVILALVDAGASAETVSRRLWRDYKMKVDHDRVYRFVIHLTGTWPHSRPRKKQEGSCK